MFCHAYLRQETVSVPTVARTEAGYYLDLEPMEIATASDQIAVAEAVKRSFERGNPEIPTPTRANFPPPVVLKYSKLKSWGQFEKNASSWQLGEQDGIYKIAPTKKHAQGGWEEDGENVVVLPPGTTLDEAVARFAAMMCAK